MNKSNIIIATILLVVLAMASASTVETKYTVYKLLQEVPTFIMRFYAKLTKLVQKIRGDEHLLEQLAEIEDVIDKGLKIIYEINTNG